MGKAILIFLVVIAKCKASNLPLCTSATKATPCIVSQDYNPALPPQDSKPIIIKPVVGIVTIEIDEENQIVTLFMEMKLNWKSEKLDISNSNLSWYQIQDHGSIWHPTLYFDNMEKLKKLAGHGRNSNAEFWFHHSAKTLWYSEFVEVQVACKMDFSGFPLDSNTCNITFGAYDFNDAWIRYESIIVAHSDVMIEKEEQILLVPETTSPFEVQISQLKPFTTNFKTKMSNSNYSQTGFQIFLKRKEIGSLASTLYIPTATYAVFVHASYMMHQDAIPGRIGLIVTMFLMASNVYIGIEAPSRRGFSYTETWIIGSQVPIVLALVEFGFILGIQKYFKKCYDFRQLDLYSLIISLVFYATFNLYYWSVV